MTDIKLIKDDTVTRSTTTYIARTMCVNHKGEQVTRYAGTVRGMSDSGRPGWQDYADHFLTAEDAAARVKYPTGLNCYDGTHMGAPIEIIRVMVHAVTTTKWEIVENNG